MYNLFHKWIGLICMGSLASLRSAIKKFFIQKCSISYFNFFSHWILSLLNIRFCCACVFFVKASEETVVSESLREWSYKRNRFHRKRYKHNFGRKKENHTGVCLRVKERIVILFCVMHFEQRNFLTTWWVYFSFEISIL